jgi:hypothetical protein
MDAQAKQQVVERIKRAANVLVTVSRDPSVDQLAACIGLTLMLAKLGKHATAVFSGKVPSTIEFLQPEKTLEKNTDSLRDFIISLDKSKADKLRYKVEDQFVRIFITPYKTSLSEKDLQFGQGDFNVEVVMALGVSSQDQLDEAITAHGKILHDATVVSVNSGQAKNPNIGQINWVEPQASSLSEMLVSISEAFGANLIDAQMATAFLTGIVSETDRFGNQKTSPKVMTMSAQLMAAGANQQLIAEKLEPPEPEPEQPKAEVVQVAPVQPADPKAPKREKPEQTQPDGTLKVDHKSNTETSEEIDITSSEIRIDTEGNLKKAAEQEQKAKEAAEAKSEPQPAPTEEAVTEPQPPAPTPVEPVQPAPQPVQAPEPKPQEDNLPHPGSHTLMNTAPLMESPFSAAGIDDEDPPAGNATTGANSGFIGHAPSVVPPVEPKFNMPTDTPPPEESARSAVEQAYQAGSANPAEALSQVITPSSQDPNVPPAPPFPPPLTPAQGVVIPPPPYNPSQNGKTTSNTL